MDSVRAGQRTSARVQPTGNQSHPGRGAPRPNARDSARVDEVRLTHPDRVLMREPPITKQELADFYRSIADFILPGLVNRPLMLLRCPNGAAGQCFFQKHAGRGFPASVRQVSDPGSDQRWMYVDGLEGLLALVQMNAIEYHVWQTTVADLSHADRVVIDLDPAPGVPWHRVQRAALEIHGRLVDLNLKCFVRTSGGKGLHVVIPVRPATDWDQLARPSPGPLLSALPPTSRRNTSASPRRHGATAKSSSTTCAMGVARRPCAPTPYGIGLAHQLLHRSAGRSCHGCAPQTSSDSRTSDGAWRTCGRTLGRVLTASRRRFLTCIPERVRARRGRSRRGASAAQGRACRAGDECRPG